MRLEGKWIEFEVDEDSGITDWLFEFLPDQIFQFSVYLILIDSLLPK